MYNRSNDGRDGEDRDRRRDRDRERDRDYHHRGSGSSGYHHHHYRSDRDRDRDDRHGSGDDDYRHRERDHRKSRSRWDSKESSSKPSSRWDRQPEEAQDLGSKLTGTGAAVSRWDKGNDSERSVSHETFGHRERSRKSRSRSRSSSPFQRSDRDYSRYSNPSRSDVMERTLGTVENNCTNDTNKKTGSNWSDSSDDEEEKYKKREGQKEANSSRNSQISTFGADSGENPKFSSSSNPYPTGLTLKLDPLPKPSMPLPKILSVTKSAKSTNVASVFNDSDDDEPEEMPAECKMRMKNVGRDTKTSEGPNSFGKTKIGFCNVRHLTGKELEGSTNPVPPSKSHKKY